MNLSNSTFLQVLVCLLVFYSGASYGQNKPFNSNVQQLSSELPTRVYSPNSKVNFFRTFDIYKKIGSLDLLNSSVASGDVMMTTEYLDGLSRPFQEVVHKYLPNGNDRVSFTYYDQLGRKTYEPMSFGVNGTGGEMRLNPTGEMNTFLSPLFSSEDIFYSKNIFDNSPLNQVRKKIGTGNSWTIANSGISTSSRPNLVSDGVKKLKVALGSSSVYVDGSYPSGTLLVTVSHDENGNETREFVNRRGQKILSRSQVSASPPSLGAGVEWLSTYYVYDDKGLLREVFPPRATKILEDPSNNWSLLSGVDDLIFRYQYDDRGRMIEKKVPGAGLVEMVYDKIDRLVATRDANMTSQNKWLFTKYDNLNRVVMTGFITSTSNRSALQSVANATVILNVGTDPLNTLNVLEANSISLSAHVSGTEVYRSLTTVEFLPGFDSEGQEFETEIAPILSPDYTFVQGYHDATFPLLTNYPHEVLTLNYFDNYDFTAYSYDDTKEIGFYSEGTENAGSPEYYANPKSLGTGTKLKVLGTDDQWLTNVMFYDAQGRIIQTYNDNHLGGTDINTTQYDFGGKVLNSYAVHQNPESPTAQTTIAKQYSYDNPNSGRLETVKERLNDTGSYKVLLTNSYNALGELDTKELGNQNSPLETLKFDYNIRGWINGINKDYVAGTNTNHYFGMELSYDRGFTNNQLNGNVSGMKWKSKSSNQVRAYGFYYDPISRISKADYSEGISWVNTENDFSTTYSYDANGNILSLLRKGVVAGSIQTIDNLQYDYGMGLGVDGNSNQLLAVSDTQGDLGQGDFVDGNSGMDYAYDFNGNMTQDLNKGIGGGDITYNHLNLPERIEFDNNANKIITYAYDAAGIKLRKTVSNNGVTTTTDYVGGFIYENNELQHFAHKEGRVRKNASGTLVYDYFIKDHLGDTRVTLTEEEQTTPTTYLATMEVDYRQWETDDSQGLGFGNISTVNTLPNAIANKTVDVFNELVPPAPNMVLRTNGSHTNLRIGANKMIKVMTDDVVSVEAYASTGNVQDGGSLSTITASILSVAFGGASSGGLGGEAGAIYNMFDSQYSSILAAFPSSSSAKAKAYLNWILFDENFEVVDSGTGFDQVSNGVTKQLIQSPQITIPGSGYFYVYVSNEGTQDVYFDDVRLEHTRGQILQEDHYYPFGMNINALSSTATLSKPNTFNTFQGQERTEDFDLNWIQFKWRNHNPQTARFFNVDPLAEDYLYNSPYAFSENKVTSHVELEGLEAVSIQAEFRAAVPIAWAGVTGSSSIGLSVGFSDNSDGIFVVPYISSSLGVSGGTGVSAGITGSVSSGNLEDLEGFGFNVGGFLSVIPGSTTTSYSGEINFTANGDPGITSGVGFSAGGAVYGEAAFTYFLTEPMDIQSLLENGLVADIAKSLGKSVEEVGDMLNVMKGQAIKEREKIQRQRDEFIKTLYRELTKEDKQFEIKSDNTRMSSNVGSASNN